MAKKPKNAEIMQVIDKKDIEIIIQDTGIGISEEEYENIFKPYYQISHKKSNIQGIGMGLNITKKIIDDAGGIENFDDALDYIMCGASAVTIGSANYKDPKISEKIAHQFEKYFKENKIENLNQIRGII